MARAAQRINHRQDNKWSVESVCVLICFFKICFVLKFYLSFTEQNAYEKKKYIYIYT